MRNPLLALTAAAAIAAATPAGAQPRYYAPAPPYLAPAAGVVAGGVVGLGLYHGWWTNSAGFPTSAAGAAATGALVGIGTAALIHAATTPCQGFHAAFGNLFFSSQGCVNGRWVGVEPVRRTRVTRRR